MSKVLGIIGEYNPFHNGHLYHLLKSKKATSADYTIALMSGNFTQRGDTSLIDKWSKTKLALANGIDLVIELPVLYSISSAENFAERMRDLENIATSFPGIDKAYAISAGREIRVIVEPKQIDDLTALKLARDIANKIEATMSYPGTIKVNVIRETRAVEYAK